MEAQWFGELALLPLYVCSPRGPGVAHPQLSCGRGRVYSKLLPSWLLGGEGSSNQITLSKEWCKPRHSPKLGIITKKLGKKINKKKEL